MSLKFRTVRPNRRSNVVSHLHGSRGEPPRILGGRWEIIAPLAEGGMGTLYVAKHCQTGREAALKVIEGDNPEALARFKLEASVAATLNHPGIVQVFDADFDPQTSSCFIAMELLRGRTLREVMDDSTAHPQQVVELLTMAMEPLALAHARGYVHRDLKPDNLFVVEEANGPARVKLLDFGIAAQQGVERLTQVGTAMGTPHYMSPEQATNARGAGPASDVWALGVMLYEAISGEVPFLGDTAHAVVVAACTRDHEPLDVAVVGVAPDVARLVDACLAKEPHLRPADAGELLSRLQRLVRPDSLPPVRPQRTRGRLGAEALASGMRTLTRSVRTQLSVARRQRVPVGLMIAGAILVLGSTLSAFFDVIDLEFGLLLAALGAGLSVTGALVGGARTPSSPAAPNPELAASPAPATPLPKVDVLHPSRGPSAAPVSIELYADLSSAVARRACQRLMALRLEHPDDIRLVFKPMPDAEREIAWVTAETLRHVFEHSSIEAFWELFDRLLCTTQKLSQGLLEDIVTTVGIQLHELRRSLRARHRQRVVASCRKEALARGATGNPTVFMNGRPLNEDLTDDRLRWAYFDALNEAKQRTTAAFGGRATVVAGSRPRDTRMSLRGLLVRYQGARNAPRNLRRTRDEAMERALKLLARAQLPRTDFADIALRFSDGLVELGEVKVSDLGEPMQSAIAQLALFELSCPVECDEGFHVLQRVV